MKQFGLRAAVLSALALLLSPLPAQAQTPIPYESYQYAPNEESVSAPVGYRPVKAVDGAELGIASFGEITDMTRGADGRLYLTDGSAGVLHVLTAELEYAQTVSFTEEGKPAQLTGMQGIWLDERHGRRYFLADPERKRVAIADEDGRIISSLTAPPAEMMPDGSVFKPSHILVDDAGVIYVLLQNFYRGALIYTEAGDFQTFYGANRVEMTPRLLLDYLWKKLLNETQKEAMSRYVPVSFANFDIDAEGFIYTVTEKTVTGGSVIGTDQIKKFNAKGVNILESKTYGDLEMAYQNQKIIQTAFVDVDVMDNGCLAALDATQGRVFLYDQDAQLVTVFGGTGGCVGNFRVPVSIETIGSDIYVADQMTGTVTRFTPTDYGAALLEATAAYRRGEYTASMELWESIRRYNGANAMALRGIGKARLDQGDYPGAMECFRQAGDAEAYSAAFEQRRADLFRSWFLPVFLVFVALVVWLVVMDVRKKNYLKQDVNAVHLPLGRKIWYTVRHPTEGFSALAGHQSVRSLALTSAGCLAVWFLVTVVEWEWTGFAFNAHAGELFSIWPILGRTVLVFGLFVLSAWFVSTMADGSARFIDIVMVTAVGLLPYMTGLLLKTALSNLLTRSEGAYLSLLLLLMTLWSAVLIFAGFKALMEYSFWKNLLILLYTLLGILIILFLALLLWSLFQQVAMFAVSLWEEVSVLLKGGGA